MLQQQVEAAQVAAAELGSLAGAGLSVGDGSHRVDDICGRRRGQTGRGLQAAIGFLPLPALERTGNRPSPQVLRVPRGGPCPRGCRSVPSNAFDRDRQARAGPPSHSCMGPSEPRGGAKSLPPQLLSPPPATCFLVRARRGRVPALKVRKRPLRRPPAIVWGCSLKPPIIRGALWGRDSHLAGSR